MISETSVNFNNLTCLSARKYFNRRVQKIAKSDHLLRRVSAHPTESLFAWKNSAPIISMKFDIQIYFENLSRKLNVESNNNRYLNMKTYVNL